MSFQQVSVYNFRNLQQQKIDIQSKKVFLIGDNGQGKTNFLEVIYYLSYASSFRSRNDSQIVKIGENQFSIIGDLQSDNKNSQIKILWTSQGKRIYLDDTKISDRKELIMSSPSILFCHNDLEFVNGSPERKRWFMDQTLALYEHGFIDLLRDYKKILNIRNIEIKKRSTRLLETLNLQLAVKGIELQNKRYALITAFSKVFTKIFTDISVSDTLVTIEYRPSWPKENSVESIVALLKKKQETDFLMKTSTSGPHRDRYLFKLGTIDFEKIASTGQVRLMALILRIAQAQFFYQKIGIKPILLLDDVLLELDPQKRDRFFQHLPPYAQIFFTFLPDEQYMRFSDDNTLILSVKNGKIFHNEKGYKAG